MGCGSTIPRASLRASARADADLLPLSDSPSLFPSESRARHVRYPLWTSSSASALSPIPGSLGGRYSCSHCGVALRKAISTSITVRRMLFSTAIDSTAGTALLPRGNAPRPRARHQHQSADGTVLPTVASARCASLIDLQQTPCSLNREHEDHSWYSHVTRCSLQSSPGTGHLRRRHTKRNVHRRNPSRSGNLPGDCRWQRPTFITDSDNLALDGNADGTAAEISERVHGAGCCYYSNPDAYATETPTPTVTPTPSPDPIKVLLRPERRAGN